MLKERNMNYSMLNNTFIHKHCDCKIQLAFSENEKMKAFFKLHTLSYISYVYINRLCFKEKKD